MDNWLSVTSKLNYLALSTLCYVYYKYNISGSPKDKWSMDIGGLRDKHFFYNTSNMNDFPWNYEPKWKNSLFNTYSSEMSEITIN